MSLNGITASKKNIMDMFKTYPLPTLGTHEQWDGRQFMKEKKKKPISEASLCHTITTPLESAVLSGCSNGEEEASDFFPSLKWLLLAAKQDCSVKKKNRFSGHTQA